MAPSQVPPSARVTQQVRPVQLVPSHASPRPEFHCTRGVSEHSFGEL